MGAPRLEPERPSWRPVHAGRLLQTARRIEIGFRLLREGYSGKMSGTVKRCPVCRESWGLQGGSVKRWIVVAALALAVAGGIVTPGAARASSTAWYQVYQSRASGSFYDIAAISKTNIWAVGHTYTTAGKAIYRPFIRHFNGARGRPSRFRIPRVPPRTG